ncbi:MAG TPA: hypothetical protein VK933_06405 [Longimicrobiales bacterium]|nr:hypothetical protein [Longimicrobiales bacterium]
MALIAWLLIIGFIVLRHFSISRTTLFAFDWYSLMLVYLFTSYVFPVLAIFVGIDMPLGSYVHDHPGAANSALGGTLLLVFGFGSWTGYTLTRGPGLHSLNDVQVDRRLLVGLIAIIAASTAAWIIGFGGFVQAITNVMMIRFGTVTSDSSVPWFMGLTKAAWFSSVIALDAMIRSKSMPDGSRTRLLAWVLLTVSALALILVGSRGAIGNVLLSMLLYVFARRSFVSPAHEAHEPRKRGATLITIVATAVAIVVLFKPAMTLITVASTDYTLAEAVDNFRLDVRTGTSTEGGSLSVFGKVASEFSHFPIMSTLAFEDDQRQPQLRDYGGDLFIAVAKLLPASIYEPPGVPLSYRSTQLILGTWESQVPPGIIAWLLFTGGPLCLLYGSVLCGVFLAAAERAAVSVLGRTWWRESGYIAFGVTVGAGIIGGAPGDLVRELGTMTAVLVVAVTVGTMFRLLPQRQLRASVVTQ